MGSSNSTYGKLDVVPLEGRDDGEDDDGSDTRVDKPIKEPRAQNTADARSQRGDSRAQISGIALAGGGSPVSSFSSRPQVAKYTELQRQVAFYPPSGFPMCPIVTQETMNICRRSWARLMLPVTKGGKTIAGLTIFYTEFYAILSAIDQGGYFEKALLAHSSGGDTIAAKGGLLIRIINFSLSLDPDNPGEVDSRLAATGRVHKIRNIRPWMYQGFAEALLSTLQLVLRDNATPEVMSAWCNLLSLVMKKMLPAAIDGMVHPQEMDANFSGHVLSAKSNPPLAVNVPNTSKVGLLGSLFS
jgi:hypothetical protein